MTGGVVRGPGADRALVEGCGPHPNRWIYTLADTPHLGHGGWGFVKDSDVIDETNPLPRC
ncbi:hypothetical protein ABZT23_19840 [Streptomyces sp. NPDC005386]|uniref:hypothetical protein n=1 Tax=Streptomyces sp. NPDC005386 TaxID=3154562 RepID=UPI0033AC563C